MYAEANGNAYMGNVTDLSDNANTDVNVALLATGHTPDTSAHDNWSDVSGDEVSGTGYTTGGETFANITWTRSTDTYTFDADDVTWGSSTISAGYAVVYDNTPAADADKKLLTLVDFEGEESSDNGDFTIQWDSTNGIFQLQANP